MKKGPFERMIDEEIARGAAPALKTGAIIARLIEEEREEARRRERAESPKEES